MQGLHTPRKRTEDHVTHHEESTIRLHGEPTAEPNRREAFSRLEWNVGGEIRWHYA